MNTLNLSVPSDVFFSRAYSTSFSCVFVFLSGARTGKVVGLKPDMIFPLFLLIYSYS